MPERLIESDRLQAMRLGWSTPKLLTLLLLILVMLSPGCASPKPEVRTVVQTVATECPKPPELPPEVRNFPAIEPGYFLKRAEKRIFETEPLPIELPLRLPSAVLPTPTQ